MGRSLPSGESTYTHAYCVYTCPYIIIYLHMCIQVMSPLATVQVLEAQFGQRGTYTDCKIGSGHH